MPKEDNKNRILDFMRKINDKVFSNSNTISEEQKEKVPAKKKRGKKKKEVGAIEE